jgi:hypothetical protein
MSDGNNLQMENVRPSTGKFAKTIVQLPIFAANFSRFFPWRRGLGSIC